MASRSAGMLSAETESLHSTFVELCRLLLFPFGDPDHSETLRYTGMLSVVTVCQPGAIVSPVKKSAQLPWGR